MIAADHHTDQLGLERLIFFSDAVFAIAITLLALEIRLPDTDELLTNTQLASQLAGMWHEYLAYILSFLVIGTFWMAHHRKYRYIIRYDNRLLFLNLMMLMVIAFIPFPSSIISKYPDRSATIFYALTMATAGILLAGNWWYASHHNRLIDPNLDVRISRRQLVAPLVTTAIFLFSILISFLNANLSRISWLLILLASWYANKD
ncbi:MAG: TMEM175 family protein [Anaerolineales bacterium]